MSELLILVHFEDRSPPWTWTDPGEGSSDMQETLSGDDWTLVVAAFHSPIDLEFKRFGPWRDPSRPLRWF